MKKLSKNALNEAILTAFERTRRAVKDAAMVEYYANVACVVNDGRREQWAHFYHAVRHYKAIGAAI